MSAGLWVRISARVQIACAIVAVVCVSVTSSPEAGVYKCAGEQGNLIYQENPCPPGKELRNFDLDPPTLSVIPGVQGPATTPAPRESSKPPPKSVSLERGDKAPGKVIGDATGRKFIRTGMSEAEVLARIGRPDITAGGSRNNHSRWSYLPTSEDPDTITTITFNGSTVSDVTRKLVKR